MDAARGANTNGHDTITIRWQEDEKYRKSQFAHGWTEEQCKYLDYLRTIDIESTATWRQRHRYESAITLAWSTKDRQCTYEQKDVISNPLRKISQVFDKSKEDKIPIFRRTREQGKDHSTMICKRNQNS